MRFAEFPDLSFPMVEFGPKQRPWDLRSLTLTPTDWETLAASRNSSEVDFTNPQTLERLDCVARIHAEMCADLVAGGSRRTASNRYYQLRKFFAWADERSLPLDLSSIENTFLCWSQHLAERSNRKKIRANSAVHAACRISTLLDRVLERSRPLLKQLQVSKRRSKTQFNVAVTRGLLTNETLLFGRMLMALRETLSTSILRSLAPIVFCYGNVCRSFSLEPVNQSNSQHVHASRTTRHLTSARILARSRRSAAELTWLINIRMEAELLIFISQTGLNLQQAFDQKFDNFRYNSYLDGYQVRGYKSRRNGTVLFEFYSEYRPHFESYLIWRKEWSLPGETRLFPFILGYGTTRAPEFRRIRTLCKQLGIEYFGPQYLRNVRINWFLVELHAPKLVSEVAQHDAKTLLGTYAQPNSQLALVEIGRLHKENEAILFAPAPGLCSSGAPQRLADAPVGIAEPDCINPAGCIFCSQLREVDSEDYVWSLATYRHLKSIELSTFRPPRKRSRSKHPAEVVIDRLTEKLCAFEALNDVRREWVRESKARIDEGHFHPMWDGFIRLHELGGKST